MEAAVLSDDLDQGKNLLGNKIGVLTTGPGVRGDDGGGYWGTLIGGTKFNNTPVWGPSTLRLDGDGTTRTGCILGWSEAALAERRELVVEQLGRTTVPTGPLKVIVAVGVEEMLFSDGGTGWRTVFIQLATGLLTIVCGEKKNQITISNLINIYIIRQLILLKI